MNKISLKILKKVAGSGEVSLAEAIRLAKPRQKSHLDQYPLALLLEEGYMGMTLTHNPPAGAETMREFSLATTLHMFSLSKGKQGHVQYLGIVSTGGLDPENERVFLKAKGSLYLDERRKKQWDRFIVFALGLVAGVLTAIATSWTKGHLKLP